MHFGVCNFVRRCEKRIWRGSNSSLNARHVRWYLSPWSMGIGNGSFVKKQTPHIPITKCTGWKDGGNWWQPLHLLYLIKLMMSGSLHVGLEAPPCLAPLSDTSLALSPQRVAIVKPQIFCPSRSNISLVIS